jgi:hypothetical protein
MLMSPKGANLMGSVVFSLTMAASSFTDGSTLFDAILANDLLLINC